MSVLGNNPQFHACFVVSEPLWRLLSSEFATSCCLLQMCRCFGETLTLEAVRSFETSSRCWHTRWCHNQAARIAITELFENKGRPETCGRPEQANSLLLLKTDILEAFKAWVQGCRTFWRRVLKLPKIWAEILSRMGNWIYWHRISDYSSDVLVPPRSYPAGPALLKICMVSKQLHLRKRGTAF